MGEAKNRYGEIFSVGDEVNIRNGYHPSCDGRVFIVETIEPFDACESGYMILLKDKETGNIFKKKLDTNWFIKIKN